MSFDAGQLRAKKQISVKKCLNFLLADITTIAWITNINWIYVYNVTTSNFLFGKPAKPLQN